MILNPHGCSCGFVGRVGRAKPQAVLLVLVLASNRQFAQFAKEGRTPRFICSLSVLGVASIRACLSQYRLRSSASPTTCDDLHAQGTVLRGFARVVRVELVEQFAPLCLTSLECVLQLCSPSQLLVLLCSPSQLLVLVMLTSQFYYVSRNSSPVCRSTDFRSSKWSSATARYPPEARRVP